MGCNRNVTMTTSVVTKQFLQPAQWSDSIQL
jgi:hypothetical protein